MVDLPALPRRDPEVSAYVEAMGDLFAQLGQARIAGRVVGWLLVCDPAHQSAADLERAIGASKASISAVTRTLLASGLVETLGVAGDRRTHFRIRPGAWTDMLVAKLRWNDHLRAAAERGLAILVEAPPERRARLEEMKRFYDFFQREFEASLGRWRAGEDHGEERR